MSTVSCGTFEFSFWENRLQSLDYYLTICY